MRSSPGRWCGARVDRVDDLLLRVEPVVDVVPVLTAALEEELVRAPGDSFGDRIPPRRLRIAQSSCRHVPGREQRPRRQDRQQIVVGLSSMPDTDGACVVTPSLRLRLARVDRRTFLVGTARGLVLPSVGALIGPAPDSASTSVTLARASGAARRMWSTWACRLHRHAFSIRHIHVPNDRGREIVSSVRISRTGAFLQAARGPAAARQSVSVQGPVSRRKLDGTRPARVHISGASHAQRDGSPRAHHRDADRC